MILTKENVLDHVIVADNSCWVWIHSTNAAGYAQGYINGHVKRNLRMHRVYYELLVGPIPQGLQLDHLCRVRSCVNPAHLRPVTNRQNVMAEGSLCITKAHTLKTNCPHGHPYDKSNTSIGSDGGRYCKKCAAIRTARYKLTHKLQSVEGML